MPQIINDNPSIGALLGQGVGQGLSTGLQQLAQLKIQHLLEQKRKNETTRGLEALGFATPEAQQIALLPKELQSLVLKNYLSAAENAGVTQGLQALQGGQTPSQEDILKSVLQLETPTPSPDISARPYIKKGLGISPEDIMANLMNKEISQTEAPAKKRVQEEGKISSKEQLVNLLRSPRTTPEQKIKLESLRQQRELAEKKISAKEQEIIDKETLPLYKDIQSKYKAAKEGNMRLDRMEEIIKGGNLTNKGVVSVIKAASPFIDLSGLLSADTQEFEKLSNDFIKNAKEYFGNRLTDQDLKAFLKTIPTATQSEDGIKRVIRNLRTMNDAALIYKKASDEILKRNNSRRPRNYEQLVEELSEKKLDSLADKFKKGL